MFEKCLLKFSSDFFLKFKKKKIVHANFCDISKGKSRL